MDTIGVLTTVASMDQARQLARAIVERRLAACAQLSSIESFYHWNGVVQDEPEVRVLFKTTRAQHARLQAALLGLHPYALPAIYAVELFGVHAPYAQWVSEHTHQEDILSTDLHTSASAVDQAGSPVVPCLRYRDAPAAIEWLCSAFGFSKQAVHADADGSIAHAQLVLDWGRGRGMIMLGSVSGKDSEWGRLTRQPDEIGGAETQSAYLVVADAEAVYARAKAAGATIRIEIKTEDYGGRGFTCSDPEGHIWNIGSYDPWA